MAGANKDQYEAASMTYIETIKDIRDMTCTKYINLG